VFCFCVEIFRIIIFFPWKRHTHYIIYFLAQKKLLRNLKMPSGCKRERNVFTILNFCATRYRLFDDTQELRQEWKLEKIKTSFFSKTFFVCYTPGYDDMGHTELKYSIAGVEFQPAKQFISSSFVLYFHLSRWSNGLRHLAWSQKTVGSIPTWGNFF